MAPAEDESGEPTRQHGVQVGEGKARPEQEGAEKEAADAAILRREHHGENQQGH
jgi:hypothetical protein